MPSTAYLFAKMIGRGILCARKSRIGRKKVDYWNGVARDEQKFGQ